MNAELRAKTIAADDAAALVRSGQWIDYGGALSQPELFDQALARRAASLHDVRIRACMTMSPRAVLEADPHGDHFYWFNWHFSGYDRARNVGGRCNYIPMNFGEAPDYYRRFIPPIDVVCLRTTPMDEQGFFNFGATAAYLKAATERARAVIVETCEAMPYVYGSENAIHLRDVTHVIDGGRGTLPELANPPTTTADQAVAALIAAEIEDGACLQIGIGGMPNAVCEALTTAGLRDLGIHTEMFVDGMVDLVEAGVVTGARKAIDPFQIVFTFAAGSRRQYDFLHHNTGVRSCAVDYTNLPATISRNSRVVSINNTTQIDLQGQAASESDGHRHLTGTGGQLQFVRGAYASPGGKSFMSLASTYEKRGQRRSRIVTTLTPGNIVTTPRTDTMYVVTEYGLVNLKGKSVAERALALIGIAHPDFRDELEREARELNLIPRRFH
ncbi:MAG TPA: acetyl-CoA hydrolase/transferase C-terminal domain-containing protein [Candidatus Dormibacteraeota bacterium]|nr:acetyl-CoA hydrolase/transferase C-terminal domain-containing protein [Candidatus Dormibacteraeota bacterium]